MLATPRLCGDGWRPRKLARLRAAWLAVLVLVGGGVACDPFASRHPNVVLVTIDTLRADHVGAYGYGLPTTPQIDRLAAEGALFEVAYAPMGTTTPSHATLFTSRHPLAHGVVRNGLPLLDAEQTLTEVLGEHGFTTAAFVSSFPVSRRFGFDQGFDHYDEDFDGGGDTFRTREWLGFAIDGHFDRRGKHTVTAALEWLESGEARPPFFLWLHLFDPHGPYVAPEPFQAFFPLDEGNQFRKRRARYDAEIRYADTQLGTLLAALPAASPENPPLVMVTSDHGEGLSQHGWPDHDRTLYEEEVRVPWVMHWPGRIAAGTRLDPPAHLIDLAPTLLGLLGIAGDGLPFEGRDLSAALQGAAPDRERPLWLQRPYYRDGHPRAKDRGWGFGVRVGPWKLIEAPGGRERELYQLEDDPQERTDLAAQRPDHVKQLSEQILHWRRQEASKAVPRTNESPEDVRRALDALGYGDSGP